MTDHWLSLTNALTQTMRSHAPGWTDRGASDPSITLLEVISYLAENLQYHATSSDELSSAAVRAIQALEAVADHASPAVFVDGERWQRVDAFVDSGPDSPVFTADQSTGAIAFGDGEHGRLPPSGARVTVRYRQPVDDGIGHTWLTVRTRWPPPHRHFGLSLGRRTPDQLLTGVHAAERWSGTTRPNYFPGKLLGVDDFRDEQTYHRDKHRRHVQALHGFGVVLGLDVSVSSDGAHVTVTPGVAIDAHGREIVLDEPVVITPANATSQVWLVLEYAERAVDFVPASNDPPQARRIEEGCRLTLTAASSDTAVTLACLRHDANAWRIDHTFAPARAR